jgi:hypothetical protein
MAKEYKQPSELTAIQAKLEAQNRNSSQAGSTENSFCPDRI